MEAVKKNSKSRKILSAGVGVQWTVRQVGGKVRFL
jgi:hypothetical protein